MSGRHDRVARLVGRGRVAAGTRHVDRELVHGRHHGVARDADLAERQRRPEVHAEDRVGAGIVEDAVGDHGLRAAGAFLSRLEREDDASLRGRVENQKIRRRVQRRHVSVVPARVHLPVRRGESEAGLLGEGKRVHVGPQEDRLSGPPRVEDGLNARPPDARAHGERARAHAIRDEAGRLDLLERGLRPGMDLAAEADGPGLDLLPRRSRALSRGGS